MTILVYGFQLDNEFEYSTDIQIINQSIIKLYPSLFFFFFLSNIHNLDIPVHVLVAKILVL